MVQQQFHIFFDVNPDGTSSLTFIIQRGKFLFNRSIKRPHTKEALDFFHFCWLGGLGDRLLTFLIGKVQGLVPRPSGLIFPLL